MFLTKHAFQLKGIRLIDNDKLERYPGISQKDFMPSERDTIITKNINKKRNRVTSLVDPSVKS